MDTLRKGLKILLISSGEFSGIKSSLVFALKAKGCEVIETENALSYLRLRYIYTLMMYMHSLIVYKLNFRRFLNRTYTSYWVHSKANQAIVKKYDNIDTILLFNSNYIDTRNIKLNNKKIVLFTDHTNLLSKKLPNYGFNVPQAKIYPRWNKIERNVLSQLDHVFVMGGYVKDSMISDYGVDANKVTVVGGGPNLDVDAERNHIIKEYTGKNILFVGLQAERKGLPVLKRAFETVIKNHPDAKLHVVGVNGTNTDSIFYYGKLTGEKLKNRFYASQVFVLPTYREPFGIVFLEAAWAKNVCIGTNVGAIPEIIEDGESGYLIEPGDSDKLAERINSLFSDPAKVECMAQKAYKIAKDKWRWEYTADRIVSRINNGNC